MEDKKIMSFENFKENLNSDYFGQLKKIYVEREILSCFGSSKIQYKFKLDLNETENSKVIYSCNSSDMLIMKNDEYSENELKEKSLEFKTINQINLDNQDNLEGCNISKIQNPLFTSNANSDDYFIEIYLYIGKNLIILYHLQEKLIIISTFAGQNNINDNYYLLDLILIMKFEKLLHLRDVKAKILEIENYDNIKEYILHKILGDKSSISKNKRAIYQLFEENINKLNNDINKNLTRSQINLRNNLKIKKINKNSTNMNINNDDNFEEEEKEINTGEDNIINDIKDENNGEVQKTKKLKKKDIRKKPIKVKASFEIEEIFKSFGFLQIQDHVKTILSVILLFPILCVIIKYIFFR